MQVAAALLFQSADLTNNHHVSRDIDSLHVSYADLLHVCNSWQWQCCIEEDAHIR